MKGPKFFSYEYQLSATPIPEIEDESKPLEKLKNEAQQTLKTFIKKLPFYMFGYGKKHAFDYMNEIGNYQGSVLGFCEKIYNDMQSSKLTYELRKELTQMICKFLKIKPEEIENKVSHRLSQFAGVSYPANMMVIERQIRRRVLAETIEQNLRDLEMEPIKQRIVPA